MPALVLEPMTCFCSQFRTDQFGVMMRERLMWDVREGVIGADTFVPKHAVIATWKNMSFAGGIDNSLYKVRIRTPPATTSSIAAQVLKLKFQ